MVHIPKPFISDLMHIYAPEGFEKREPGANALRQSKKAPPRAVDS
jgi:hypothetical protein